MNHAERSTRGRRRGVETCTSALIVIRHADDMRSNDERDSKGNKEPYGTGWSTSGIETCVRAADGNADYLAVPAGSSGVSLTAAGQPVHQHCLTPNGQAHAHAYAASLSSFLLKNRLCPVGSVVTQEPFTGKVWPSANPFETALPLAQKSGAPIAMVPSSTAFATSSERAALLEPASANSSVLLSWDKAGLMGSDNNGVLYQIANADVPSPIAFPDRDMLYVFTEPDASQTYKLKTYRQFFQDSAGFLAGQAGGRSGKPYYRFFF